MLISLLYHPSTINSHSCQKNEDDGKLINVNSFENCPENLYPDITSLYPSSFCLQDQQDFILEKKWKIKENLLIHLIKMNKLIFLLNIIEIQFFF
jgi:hypothetical protein